MSGKLLDTDTVVELVRANKRTITDRYIEAITAGADLFISIVTVFEFRYGMERSPRQALQKPALERLLTQITVTPFDEGDAEHTARVKAALAQSGRMIGAYDLLIAGQAMARGWTVVTGNTREFSRVEGLQVEDWNTPLG